MCYVVVAGGGVGGGEVDVECGFGADEGGVEIVEGVGEDGDGVGVAEVGESVATPAGEMYGVEGDVGLVVGWVIGKEVGGVVEGSEAGGLVAVSGEGFAVRGGEPGSQGARCGFVGAVSGALEEVDRVAGRVGVEEDKGLFGSSV